MKKFAIFLGAFVLAGVVLLGIVLALIGGAANEVAEDLDQGTTSGEVSADDASAGGGEGKDYTYEDLQVERGEYGSFAGSLRVTNTTDEAADLIVTVTAYAGDETLGELNGDVRVKPGATTSVELTSIDDFAKGATDYEVEIFGY